MKKFGRYRKNPGLFLIPISAPQASYCLSVNKCWVLMLSGHTHFIVILEKEAWDYEYRDRGDDLNLPNGKAG